MGDPITWVASWLRELLAGWGLAEGLVNFILTFLGVATVATFVLLLDIALVWVERKVVARFQDRLGPNRLGPYGLIQPFADVIKLLIKEDIIPAGADRFIFNIAPLVAMGTILLLWAVIPFAPNLIGTDINVGILYVVAVGGLSLLGIIMAGWASNNKYALLGAFRSVAQMVSYEVPMVLSLLIPVILARSMGINTIVDVQSQGIWFILLAPLSALIFFITSIAELGRAPFDLTEAESEIVAGFHIEYTGMKFGLFYAGELLHAITVSALVSSLYLGGWSGPFAEEVPLLGVLYLFIKAFLVYYLLMWVRYSLPRLRIDQMLDFCWKFLTPLALSLLIVTALVDKLVSGSATWVYVASHLGANLLLALVTLQILRKYAKTERTRVGAFRPTARTPLAGNLPEPVVQE